MPGHVGLVFSHGVVPPVPKTSGFCICCRIHAIGGSVLVVVDCERRSTIASEEASPKTARAKREREDIIIAEIP